MFIESLLPDFISW